MADQKVVIQPTDATQVMGDVVEAGDDAGAVVQHVLLAGGTEGSPARLPGDPDRGLVVTSLDATPANAAPIPFDTTPSALITAGERVGFWVQNLSDTVKARLSLSGGDASSFVFELGPGAGLFIGRSMGGRSAWVVTAVAGSGDVQVSPVTSLEGA